MDGAAAAGNSVGQESDSVDSIGLSFGDSFASFLRVYACIEVNLGEARRVVSILPP
jgi:hypothetical protein